MISERIWLVPVQKASYILQGHTCPLKGVPKDMEASSTTNIDKQAQM